MTSKLRASATATALATLLSFGSSQGASGDGRGDWDGYAWKTILIADCRPVDTLLTCPTYHQKWDWKRNQWVDLAITINSAAGAVDISQQLADKDPHDDDFVCVTALLVNAAGKTIVAHHQNWAMRHGEVVRRDFTYASRDLDGATKIHIGSKQCRDGARQDDATYAKVLAGIGS